MTCESFLNAAEHDPQAPLAPHIAVSLWLTGNLPYRDLRELSSRKIKRNANGAPKANRHLLRQRRDPRAHDYRRVNPNTQKTD